jgi:hypothetical protein
MLPYSLHGRIGRDRGQVMHASIVFVLQVFAEEPPVWLQLTLTLIQTLTNPNPGK